MAQSFTLRPKTVDFIEEKKTHKVVPGPGVYEAIDMDPKTGRFAVSKFGDSKLSIINPKTERFRMDKQSPGPSSYREGNSLSSNAKYPLSQHKGQGTRAFTKTVRSTFTDDSRKR